MQKQSDAQLIIEAQKDPNTFQMLYDKYQNQVFNYFWYRVGHNKETAEDLMQETFLRAFKRLPFYEIRGYSYLTYLLTVAHNLLVNYYRQRVTEDFDELKEVPVMVKEALDKALDAEGLWLNIHKLPPLDKEVLLLRYRRELSIKEIAQIVVKSENAVKLILSRARDKLKKYYADLETLKQLPDRAKPYTDPKFLGEG
jgi:RNA polymerase sigma-70 factor, ECF subfamily